MSDSRNGYIVQLNDQGIRIRELETCTSQISIQLATLSTDLKYVKGNIKTIKEAVEHNSEVVSNSLSRLKDVEDRRLKKLNFWKEARQRILFPLSIIFCAVFASGIAKIIWDFLNE